MKTEREVSFICQLTPQITAQAGAGSPELPTGSHVGAAQALGPYSTDFLGTLTGNWIKRGAARTQTGACAGYQHHRLGVNPFAIMPAPNRIGFSILSFIS